MPTPTTLAVFIATCILLGITPGPNMSLIVANTLSGGLRAGLTTLAGTSVGLVVLVTVAAAGMSSVMLWMAHWFDVVRWIGAVYLVFLGVRQLVAWRRGGSPQTSANRAPSAASFAHGLLVSLSNPKVLLFLGAFLPQFVDATRPTVPQLTVLAIVFWATLSAVDVAYTVAVARARTAINSRTLATLDGVAGALLLVGGAILATARRPG